MLYILGDHLGKVLACRIPDPNSQFVGYFGVFLLDCDSRGDRNCPRIPSNVHSRGKSLGPRAFTEDNIVNT